MATHKRHRRIQQRRYRPTTHHAGGFHTAEAFIAMIMLDRSGIAPGLPWHAP